MNIKRNRTKLNLTQAQLATELQSAPNTVARWERGELKVTRMLELAIECLLRRNGLFKKGSK